MGANRNLIKISTNCSQQSLLSQVGVARAYVKRMDLLRIPAEHAAHTDKYQRHLCKLGYLHADTVMAM